MAFALTLYIYMNKEKNTNYWQCRGEKDVILKRSGTRLVFDLPLYHPFHFLTILVTLGHTFLAPALYVQIYMTRTMQIANKKLGLSQKALVRRRQKNLVSAHFNFFVWISEATIVLTLIPGGNEFFFLYVLLNTGTGPFQRGQRPPSTNYLNYLA